jgi:ABC-type Fe3+-hydroxamate transport system substrate-binding protein
MPQYTDQVGRSVSISKFPRKIISLVPSQTELLYDLALDAGVTGITKFCCHPTHWFRNKTRIGGTKSINIELIENLAPDLLLANKEENRREQIETLSANYPVWVSDVHDLHTAYEMIRMVGTITGKDVKAAEIIKTIQARFQSIRPSVKKQKVCYLIWQQPYMTIGGDTFINFMLQQCGFENIFAGFSRYPTVTINDIAQAECDLVLLSSEPFPFKESHAQKLQETVPGIRAVCVDGELFSWYGSRLLKAPDYFQSLIDKL